ncbi:sugar ABC transporter substrate-binding protein [Clostridium psychrophilum]|uniref:sugar ABC transporter substrate-binding protein n=1 Tax=Clostridium psychrophilum TaxID=132926 RepID=UPI001C0DB0B0|nr:sugar ABC transporter substrate-binding protein [Clostridium psychrophilum]MBU3180212.1 sugar ABC transporter substrate-binding protein [Clostridium psychrophilum]
MKKNLSIVLIIVMITSFFTGCAVKTNTTSLNTKKIKIGVCISDFNDKFTSYMTNETKNYAKSLNDVEVVYVDSKNDSNTEFSHVKTFISQKVDVIVVQPVDTDLSQPITDSAKAAKVPIMSIGRPFENQNDAAAYVSSDSKQSAKLQMEYLAKKMHFKGNVAIMMGTMGQEQQRLRTQGYHDVIAKYPDMKIVAEQTADWDRAKGTALMEEWLQSGKKIDAVAASNDEMAIGALKAIESAGKLGKITVGGIDATPEALNYLKSGKLAVTVFQNATELGQCNIKTAVKIAKGENVEKTVIFSNELVAPKDADKYMAKWNK